MRGGADEISAKLFRRRENREHVLVGTTPGERGNVGTNGGWVRPGGLESSWYPVGDGRVGFSAQPKGLSRVGAALCAWRIWGGGWGRAIRVPFIGSVEE